MLLRPTFNGTYGLKCDPFEISPNPRFLVPIPAYNEALASIYYALSRQMGCAMLTGEIGTGKTLLVRCLLELLRRNQAGFAYVFNTCLSAAEFLHYIVRDFGLSPRNQTKPELVFELNNFLIARHSKQLTTVLVVDEAQDLPVDVLEEIRLLTNLETVHQKLLQILLVGQPELDQKLDSHALRQLKQRIVVRRCLEALREPDTRRYIYERFMLAGAEIHPASVFPEATVKVVHRCSRGIPRVINTICETALIAASACQAAFVSTDVVEKLSSVLRLESPRGSNGLSDIAHRTTVIPKTAQLTAFP